MTKQQPKTVDKIILLQANWKVLFSLFNIEELALILQQSGIEPCHLDHWIQEVGRKVISNVTLRGNDVYYN